MVSKVLNNWVLFSAGVGFYFLTTVSIPAVGTIQRSVGRCRFHWPIHPKAFTFKNYSSSSHAQLHVTQVKKVTFYKNKGKTKLAIASK